MMLTISSPTGRRSNRKVELGGAVLPLVLMAIGYIIDSFNSEIDANHQLNVSRHAFSCSMRCATLVNPTLT